MLCVDDVQRCDEASLQFLAYLVRRLEGLPVLVVLAMRTGEQQQADDLAELVADETVAVVRPAPLTEQGTAALVTDRLGRGADAFVATCHRMTSGNPLLLRQLLRALADQGVPPDAAHVDTVRAVGSRAITSLVTLRLRRMPQSGHDGRARGRDARADGRPAERRRPLAALRRRRSRAPSTCSPAARSCATGHPWTS